MDCNYAKAILSAVSLLALLASSVYAQYVYPEVNASDPRTPFYVGLMQSFSDINYDSSGVIPGIDVALDQINDDPSILPGYTLHSILTDSQCDRKVALGSFFREIFSAPTKIAWLGSGCSVATEPTAEVSQYYNITLLSCQSSSTALRDRDRFRYYFQFSPSDDNLADGYFGIIKTYGWRRVALIVQNENLFTRTMDRLKTLLDEDGIEYSEFMFESSENVADIGSRLFDPDARIFVLSMFRSYAENVLCEANKQGLKYPTHVFIPIAWYRLDNPGGNCPVEVRKRVLPYFLGPHQIGRLEDVSIVADNGVSGHEFEDAYFQRLADSPLDLSENIYRFGCYDQTWALAYALNNTITDLRDNATLRMLAANEAGLEDDDFGIENFTYANRAIVETVFGHLEDIDFNGLVGRLSFDEHGIRQGGLQQVLQYRPKDDGSLEFVTVGHVEGRGADVKLLYVNGFRDETVWPDGTPFDGVPIEEIVTVSVALTVIYGLLATAGVAFTIACLIFNFVFREKKLIQLSSGKLNYIIGAGSLMLYLAVYLSVIPTTDRDANSWFCNITPWLTSLGYSLIFGTILAKMARVYYIFNNPTPRKKFLFRDWHLAMVVLVLVVIDLVILTAYTVVEGVKGNLSASRIENRGNSMDIKGNRDVIYEYYFYTCTSDARDITLGILYGYKGVLQVVSLLFAFQIRRVKIKGLNDAKYIAATIYVTSIILAVTILSTYTLVDYVNGYVIVFGLGLLVGSAAIVALVFVPKMIGLYRDPQGELIFSKATPGSQIQSEQKMSTTGSSGSTEKENIMLRRRVTDLENSLAKLQGPTNGRDPHDRKVSFSVDHTLDLTEEPDGSPTSENDNQSPSTLHDE